VIQDVVDGAAGRVHLQKTQAFVEPAGVKTVLAKIPTGYNVLTSYPVP
jgi:hypothetical protein